MNESDYINQNQARNVSDKWKLLMFLSNSEKFLVMEGLLKSAGIKFIILKPSYKSHSNEVSKVVVHENDFDEAAKILIESGFEKDVQEAKDYYTAIQCPSCKSEKISVQLEGNFFMKIMAVFGIKNLVEKYHCKNCYYNWK